jgi:putative glutamine amidotransferase
MRPIIGITSNFSLDRTCDPPRARSSLAAFYADAVFAAGGIPHALPVYETYDANRLDELLRSVGGLMLTGGFDLDPQHYGAAVHPKATLLHERRDRFEVDLFRRADALRVPIFAICLGFQVAHVARGGWLVQHVDDLLLTPPVTHHLPGDRNAFHPVEIKPDSALARIMNTTRAEVTSRHHQIVDPDHPGDGLRPVAFAPDGVLEASEDMDGRFLLAVQWHPEDIHDRAEHGALFRSLVEAAAR